jgi:hypothetical protein
VAADETVGAVYKPVVVIDPGLADHVTCGLDALLTVAANCWRAPEATLADAGEMLTEIAAPG